jgi:hypothetical protein
MTSGWFPLPYEAWSETCDTVHAHTQVLGKLAATLAPPEPQLQHAALRLSGRGWETLPLPAPDGSGALVAALELRSHDAVAEHTDYPDPKPNPTTTRRPRRPGTIPRAPTPTGTPLDNREGFVRSGFDQGVARDSVLSFGSSVRCGHRP